MNTDEIWKNFLTKIKSKVSLMTYNYMFKDLRLLSYKNSKITIVVPNNELLLNNITKNYGIIIEDIINDITNDTCEIEYVFEDNINNIIENNEILNNDNTIDNNIIITLSY